MVDWYLVSVLIFAAFLAVLVYLDRKKWKRESILLLRKTQKGKAFLIWLGTRLPRFWKVIGMFAVIVTLLSTIWMFWALFITMDLILTGQITTGGGLLLPSPTNQTVAGPGYLAVPFWYWIISIAVLVIVHEGMHGVMAARERVRIKSLGWGLLAVIPLAFVEPDEKQLQKQKSWKQLRVFAAGSFANYVVALLSLFIFVAVALWFFAPVGVGYRALAMEYPAAAANITGDIIGINNYTIRDSGDLSDVLRTAGPNQTITVVTTNGTHNFTYTLVTAQEPEPEFTPDFSITVLAGLEHTFPGTIELSKSVSGGFAYVTGTYKQPTWSSIKSEMKFWGYVKSLYSDNPNADAKIASLQAELESHPRSGFIGILGVFDSTEIRPGLEGYRDAIAFFQGLLYFLFLINFGVGMFNMLPIGPLDGGRMWGIVAARITPKHAKTVMNILSAVSVILVITVLFVLPYL